MDTIEFSRMTTLEDQKEVVAMMRLLYEEDPAAAKVDDSRFPSTIERLVGDASAGQVVLFREGSDLRGYALLIPFWSNELGGTVLFVDELFVLAGFRNRGIGRAFFRYLERERPFEPVALGLGVSPRNTRARRLYESLGFRELRNATLLRTLDGGQR